MKLLRACDRPQQRWKNGGGATFEIAAAPPGAAITDFSWRISIAMVEKDGPFSRFANIDRELMLLAGGPLELRLPERTALLALGAPPLAFNGESACEARVAGTPATVLNLMWRRDVTHMSMWWQVAARIVAPAPGEELFVLAAREPVLINGARLEIGDAVQVLNNDLQLDTTALVIRVRPVFGPR